MTVKSISDCENNSELIKSLLDQTEYLRRENSAKSNIISSLINNKVLFDNAENLISFDNQILKIPDVMSNRR